MTNAETSTLVFKDQAGGYYLVPREVLEQGRVPAERTAELERLIAEQHDTQGHAAPLGVLVVCALLGTLVGEISGSWTPAANVSACGRAASSERA